MTLRQKADVVRKRVQHPGGVPLFVSEAFMLGRLQQDERTVEAGVSTPICRQHLDRDVAQIAKFQDLRELTLHYTGPTDRAAQDALFDHVTEEGSRLTPDHLLPLQTRGESLFQRLGID